MKRGEIYEHTKYFDPSTKEPLKVKITRIASGVVYIRPFYGLHDDGKEWLGSASYFPVDQFDRWLKPMSKKNPARKLPYYSIPVTQAKEGDLVLEHGGVFRLKERNVSKAHHTHSGETVYFRTEFLGPYRDYEVGIPPSWFNNTDRPWIVQGNRLRNVTVLETDAKWKMDKKTSRKKNPAGREHWIAKVYSKADNVTVVQNYFDGSMAAAKRFFRHDPVISEYWGKQGFVITMQPNAIILWDGYKTNPTKRRRKNMAKKAKFYQIVAWSTSAKKLAWLDGAGFSLLRSSAKGYTKDGAKSAVRNFAQHKDFKIAIVSPDVVESKIKAALLGKA